MAPVTSLDRDLRNMRLEKYTPQRADETRQWIEAALGEHLEGDDLLEGLKDGRALCRLVNLALGPNSVRFKQSSMPFVQMENISHFLRACQAPPINLQPHDCFLTVDLYEGKDPAQVLQCIGAFSRRANAIQPSNFPTAIGGKAAARNRGLSNASEDSNSTHNSASVRSGRASPLRSSATSPKGASSWAKKADVGTTAPAWNIAQYGWTGGASQGNQGISFGGRRQITSPAPHVPNLADKERKRREDEVEAERLRVAAEEAERKRRAEREAEEERAKAEEARRWEEETLKARERGKQEAEAEKRRWEAEERRWKEEEEVRVREEKAAEARLDKDRQMRRGGSDNRLQGQFLSQYQAEQRRQPLDGASAGSERIKELERQLEEAKVRERRYEEERLHQPATAVAKVAAVSVPEGTPPGPSTNVEDEFQASERDSLRQEWSKHQAAPSRPPRALPTAPGANPAPPSQQQPPTSPRPLPTPGARPAQAMPSPRPLPDPTAYASSQIPASPPPPATTTTTTTKAGASQSNAPKASGWGSMSLLEREMERERERQREWEEAQTQTKEAAARGALDPAAGSGPGQSWDVNSYGYTGGDNLNKGGGGVHNGRRQVLGPRPR